MYKKTLLSLAVASSITLTGCIQSGDDEVAVDPSLPGAGFNPEGSVYPLFDPASAVVPVPNDLIFDTDVGDGSFSVDDFSPPVTTALNQLSGASTVAPIFVEFNGQIDSASVLYGQTVFLFELSYASGDPLRALSAGEPPAVTDITNGPDGVALVPAVADVQEVDGRSAIRIQGTGPLNPGKRYIVAVTKNVTHDGGTPIDSSFQYGFLTDETNVLSGSIASVQTLMNKLWEPVVLGALSGGGPTPPDDVIAISYSFTTSSDEDVVSYMADPDDWFTDQLTKFVRSSAASNVVQKQLDLNTDDSVDAVDVTLAANGAIAAFPLNPSDPTDTSVRDALSAIEGAFATGLFSAEGGSNCDTLDPDALGYGLANEGATYIDCVGEALTGLPSPNGFADLLPTPADRSGTIEFNKDESGNIIATPAALISAAVASLPGASSANVVQGSIELPYYLGVPAGSEDGSVINSSIWTADTALAGALNTTFNGLLKLPQGTGASNIVNSIFPFPAKTADVRTPMLVMYPDSYNEGDPELPVVVFQHGITTDRSAALSVGSILTNAGYAVVAIDLPLHGIDAQDQSEETGIDADPVPANPVLNERQAVAATLLGGLDALAVEESLPLPTQNTADNAGELIDQTYVSDVAVPLVQLPATLEIGGLGCTESNPLLIASGAGGCANLTADAIAAQYVGFAIGAQNAVQNHTSVIPGIAKTANERHFNFTANAKLNPTPMIDAAGFGSSGSLYINLQGFRNSGDKSRQGSVDVLNVIQSLGDIDVTGDEVPDFDTNRVFVAGHSLGTIIATGAVAAANQSDVMTPVQAAAMYAPASGLVRMLENSPAFGERIIGGLRAAGVEQGTSSYESFLRVFQHAVDASDPINLADDLVDGGNGVITFNVVGTPVDPSAEPADLVTLYPSDDTNVIETWFTQLTSPFGITPFPDYLSGAVPFSAAMGAINVLDADGTESFYVSNLSYGNHGMFVLPSGSGAELARNSAAFTEAVTQTIQFFNGGGQISVGADTGLTSPTFEAGEEPGVSVLNTKALSELVQLNAIEE
jgi:pimeloyl-ACP methyl ester carboxylesterase